MADYTSDWVEATPDTGLLQTLGGEPAYIVTRWSTDVPVSFAQSYNGPSAGIVLRVDPYADGIVVRVDNEVGVSPGVQFGAPVAGKKVLGIVQDGLNLLISLLTGPPPDPVVWGPVITDEVPRVGGSYAEGV